MKGFFSVPTPYNEPVLSYLPGSPERERLKSELSRMRAEQIEIPLYIGADKIYTENRVRMSPPHDHAHTLGYYHKADQNHVCQAIDAALGAKHAWSAMGWENRAAVFLKAAELLAGPYRAKINAATMLCQSKTAHQAEIDSACELIDFLRFNVKFMTEIYAEQPQSSPGVWNRTEYRPLEGFVFALTPFNFTAIAGNLPTSPALMGNTVVWKASEPQIYSAAVIMEVLREAGLPDGVINLVHVSGSVAGEVIFSHRDFAGLHFTGGTKTFNHIWRTIGQNLESYKSYPRIVGETGGKDFVLAHKSADVKALAVALVRGAFEYQGQKCSAASRAYIPQSLWPSLKELMGEMLLQIKPGNPEEISTFFSAVIDEKSFNSIQSYIETARQNPLNEIVFGGGTDKSKGYFIEPTVILTQDNQSTTMCEEIFGPVLTIYLYHDEHFEEAMYLVDETSPYALTGSIFAQDRATIELAISRLENAAGNFYINDKPTGAVVGQQPFGGARASGTNDKAGSKLNLLRWVSARTIKETFVPPHDYRYPFLAKD